MKQSLTASIFCLLGALSLGAGTRSKSHVVTFHLEGEETDSPQFVTPVKLGSEHRQYFFRTMPAFTDHDMQWFYPFVSQDGQSYGAAFRLNETKSQELTAVTAANQGKLFGSRVVDAPLRAVIIDRPATDGVLVIWDGLSQNHIKLLSTKIKHVEGYISGGAPELPTFQPSGNGKSSGAPATSAGPDQDAAAKKKGFWLFGNPKKKGEPTENPFVNP